MNPIDPTISVIMPLYNHENYVEAALHSVLNQTFQNFELIVVDDCSTDDSRTKVTSISDDRVKLILNPENLGAHAAINKGILSARGEYISIINSDDIYGKNRLETLLTNCRADNVSFAGTAVVLIDETGSEVQSQDHWWRNWYDDLVKFYIDSRDLPTSILRGNFFITTSNFFFRKSLIEQIGSFRPYRYVHDYEFLFRAIVNSESNIVFYDRAPMLLYRLHSRNSILENPLEANRETFRILIEYGNQLSTGKLLDQEKILLTHLQKIRQLIEDQYLAQQESAKANFENKIAEVERAKETRILDYEQKLAGLNETLLQLQDELKLASSELSEVENSLRISNEDTAAALRQVELLQADISKIIATRGYRLEKGLYEFYVRAINLIRGTRKN